MRFLLDTHVFIWWVENNPLMGKKTRQSIAQAGTIQISIVSAWECAIKEALGKLSLGIDFEQAIHAEGFDKLNLTFDHIRMIGNIKFDHRDPFDRMLVAQAISEDLILITADRRLSHYPAKVVNARS